MKQFTEDFRKLVTPAPVVLLRKAKQRGWLKKAAVCLHAFTRCTAIMAGSWAWEPRGMLENK